jgi:hypothetical protein
MSRPIGQALLIGESEIAYLIDTGDKFDPEATVPLPVGSYVTHSGKEIHWDGAGSRASTF